MPNTGYGRNAVALSVNSKLNEKLQISSKINYTNKFSDNLPSTGYQNQSIMYFIRGLNPKYEHGLVLKNIGPLVRRAYCKQDRSVACWIIHT